MLTAEDSRYGLKLLNLLAWHGVPVWQVVTFTDLWALRRRWARRAVKRLGWVGAARYLAERRWGSPFRGQGLRWRGRELERDWARLASRHDRAPTQWSPRAVEALGAGEPDLCLLVGTGIIPPTVLAVPRLATLNAHPGILPSYRGLDPELWALHEGRRDQVGSTLHVVDAAVDTGPVLATRPYDWRGDETLGRLTVRLTETCLDLLAGACREVWPDYLHTAAPQGPGRYHSLCPPSLRRRIARALQRQCTAAPEPR